jgi:hypothetical protein
MTQITLTSDQLQTLEMATGGIIFCDPSGNVVARLPARISEEEATIIVEAKRRLASDEPRHTSAEMRARLGLPVE